MSEEIIIINDEPFYRIQNGTSYDYAPIPKAFKPYFEKLQQENQQLKEELDEARDNADYYSNVYWEKCEVLDEIREYINNYDVFKEFSFPLMKKDEENQVKTSIDYEFQTSIKKSLLQILDKVKE